MRLLTASTVSSRTNCRFGTGPWSRRVQPDALGGQDGEAPEPGRRADPPGGGGAGEAVGGRGWPPGGEGRGPPVGGEGE